MAALLEETLELWGSSLLDVKARLRPLFTQQRVARRRGFFWMACLVLRGARGVGCERKLRVIPARGANRRFWGAVAGMLMNWGHRTGLCA